MSVPEFLPPDVRKALAAGNKIEAIKRLRETAGLALKQAKDRVEALPQTAPDSDDDAEAAPAHDPFAARPMATPDVMAAIVAGNRIEAVRLYRRHAGVGLKEAREAVDRIAQGVTGTRVGALAPGEVPPSNVGKWLVPAAIAIAVALWFAWD